MNSCTPSLKDNAAFDSLGARIVSAARLAVSTHLELERQESLVSTNKAQAMIGGTDRRVTDDQMSQSVVRSPSSVVEDPNN